MPNPYINKVELTTGETLIDISDTTAIASDVAAGKYFYAASGEKIEGTSSGGGSSVTITDVSNSTGTTCVITTSGEPTPSETWETLFDNSTYLADDTPYPYWWISSLSDVYPTAGSTWRITIDGGSSYRCVATYLETYGGVIGNPLYIGGQDDGSDAPFALFNAGWGAWSGGADLSAGNHWLKIERLVTS